MNTEFDLTDALDMISKGEIQTGEAAKQLGINSRQMNRLMLRYKITRPVGARLREKSEAAQRKQARADLAKLVNRGKVSKEQAMQWLGVCERTVERYCELVANGKA